jgi:cell division protein FtsZ
MCQVWSTLILQGRNRAQVAAEEAIAGGFLNVTIRGAKRVLFNISGGNDMTLFEVNEVAERIGSAIDNTADIIFGAVVDPMLSDTMRVTLIAAGMDDLHATQPGAIHLDSGLRSSQSQTSGMIATPAPMTPNPSRRVPPAQALPPIPSPMQSSETVIPGRQQRSLNDLRGIRSMGRRQDNR